MQIIKEHVDKNSLKKRRFNTTLSVYPTDMLHETIF